MSVEELTQEIEQTFSTAELKGFSGMILLRVKGRTILAKAYGWADRQTKKRMTMDTGIEIGSIVKPITLAAILRLAEKGNLSLQDKLENHLPDVPQDKREITLEMIARHQAGFPDLFGGDYQLVGRKWLVNKVLNCQLIAKPGTEKKYSNSGYSLLAALIEIESGMSYEAFMRKELLEPAGVKRIGYVLAGWNNEDLAVGYRQSGLRWGTPLERRWLKDGPGWNLRGNGGMLATAEDLSAWYKALWKGKVLRESTKMQFLDIDAYKSDRVGGKALGHAGGNGIFNCLQVCYFLPEVYLTLFSSVADQKAAMYYKQIREQVISVAQMELF